MTTMKIFIKQYPVATYFALTFVISFGSILLVLGPEGLWDAERFEAMVPFAVLALLAGPSVAGVLMTALVDGRAGLRELGARLLRWKVGIGWYAFALLTAPLAVMATLLSLSIASPVFLPAIFTASDKGALLLSGLAAGLSAGFFEELGWTGFATPRARRRWGVLATGLLVGIVWGAWHFPGVMWGSSSAGAVPLILFAIVSMFAFILPFRVLMVWLFDRTDSLLLAMLMHVALTGGIFYVLAPAATGWAFVTYYLAVGAMLWGVVAAVAVASRGQLGKHKSVLPERAS